MCFSALPHSCATGRSVPFSNSTAPHDVSGGLSQLWRCEGFQPGMLAVSGSRRLACVVRVHMQGNSTLCQPRSASITVHAVHLLVRTHTHLAQLSKSHKTVKLFDAEAEEESFAECSENS